MIQSNVWRAVMVGAALAAIGGVQGARAVAQEPAPHPERPVLRVFDCRDLVVPQDFAAPELGLRGEAPAPPPEPEAPGAALAAAVRALPGIAWDEPFTLAWKGGNLIVKHTPEVVGRIERFLGEMRARAGRLVAVEMTVLVIPRETPVAPGAGVNPLDDARADALLRAARAKEGVRVLSAPKITLMDGQRGNLLMANELAYVSRYDVTGLPDGRQVADPVVDTVRDGFTFEVRGRVGSDGVIALDVEAVAATVARPLAEVQTRYGVVQIPTPVRQRVAGAVRLADGGYALVAGLREMDKEARPDGHLLILLRASARNLTEEEAAPRAPK